MPSISRRIPLIAATALLTIGLSACATPEARVRTGLVKAGIPDETANCMADYMVDRLSITQLRRLQSLASVKNVDYERITLKDFLYKIRALEDPELIAVTGKAALRCSI